VALNGNNIAHNGAPFDFSSAGPTGAGELQSTLPFSVIISVLTALAHGHVKGNITQGFAPVIITKKEAQAAAAAAAAAALAAAAHAAAQGAALANNG